MPTIAEVLVETLEATGVQRIYGIVGDSLNGITESLRKRNNIQWVHTRHEEAAAFAAGAEAQLTGELAVCAGSCGPGNMHLMNGLYDCQRSQAPVLAIAAHIPSPEIGSDYFQETDPKFLFKECSHFCEVIQTEEQVPRLLQIAIQTAISRKGVSVIVLSGDLALKNANYSAPRKGFLNVHSPKLTPQQDVLQSVAQTLNSSEKVTLFCGIGAKEARDEILQLCHKLQSPVVHTLRGKPYIEYDNPYDVGMTGLIGFSSGYYAMEACDTLLILGASFPYRQFYPKDTSIIQIDSDGSQLGKRTEIHQGVIGHVKDTLGALLPFIDSSKNDLFLKKAKAHYKKARDGLDKNAVARADDKPIHPQYLMRIIDAAAKEDALFCCDVGTPTVWAARYLNMNGKRKLIGSFNHGSMANALSQAIGLQSAYPKRQVIALCGDGGLAMLMGELLTLIQQQLPVKVVVFNNGTLGFVEMEMHVGGMLDFGTELKNPNFAQLAEAIGIKAFQVGQSSHLPEKIEAALKHQGPALIDVTVNRAELVMPPSIKMQQIKGFSLYLMKAIINGEGESVIELAKEQLWR